MEDFVCFISLVATEFNCFQELFAAKITSFCDTGATLAKFRISVIPGDCTVCCYVTSNYVFQVSITSVSHHRGSAKISFNSGSIFKISQCFFNICVTGGSVQLHVVIMGFWWTSFCTGFQGLFS